MMTIANMRDLGVRYVSLWCTVECNHHVDICVDEMPGEAFVPEIGRRYRCSRCGRPSPESRPAWHLADNPPAGTPGHRPETKRPPPRERDDGQV